MDQPNKQTIGILAESSLHAALKAWYARPGDQLEVLRDGFHIDLVRGNQFVEIQTRNFSALKSKLTRLLPEHPVRLVHPIAQTRWLVRRDVDGVVIRRRKSPRQGRLEWLFHELVNIAALLPNPHLSLEILLIQEEEIQVPANTSSSNKPNHKPSWRRNGWQIADRNLIAVVESLVITDYRQLLTFLPARLPELFTSADLRENSSFQPRTIQRMLYTLYHCGLLERHGRRGRSFLYSRTQQ